MLHSHLALIVPDPEAPVVDCILRGVADGHLRDQGRGGNQDSATNFPSLELTTGSQAALW